MSAYICAPEHFAALAVFAMRYGNNNCALAEWRGRDHIDGAERIAKELAMENIRSVQARYDSNDGADGEEITEAVRIAKAMCIRPPKLSAIQIIKMCHCYEYQSCETDDWQDTLACRQIRYIEKQAIRELPGYDAAEWGYQTDRYDPSVPNDGTTGPICLSALIRR